MWSIYSLTASTFLTEYRSSSTALDFMSDLECSFLLRSSNWDAWYASQHSVGLPFLFPGSIWASLLLTVGAPSSTYFDAASSASKLTSPSTNDVPRTFSTLFSSKSVSSNWSDLPSVPNWFENISAANAPALEPSLIDIFFTKSVRFSTFVLQYDSATYVQRGHWEFILLLLTCIFQQYQ